MQNSIIIVDIVLLLPKKIEEKAIELNKNLTSKNTPKIDFQDKKSIPHISLAMGIIDESELPELERRLSDLYKKYLPLDLTVKGTHKSEIENEGYLWEISIESSPSLIAMHTETINMVKEYIVKDFDPQIFAEQGPGMARTMQWIRSFADHSSYENYRPHITIGFGEERKIEKENFVATTLAICQLGLYCTCKKIIKAFTTVEASI